jgi:hypothetical protein
VGILILPTLRSSDRSKGPTLSHNPRQGWGTHFLADSKLRAVALFILLARAAGAWVVSSHFFLSADDLLNGLRVSGSGHARLFELAAFAAHEGFFQFVRRRRD